MNSLLPQSGSVARLTFVSLAAGALMGGAAVFCTMRLQLASAEGIKKPDIPQVPGRPPRLVRSEPPRPLDTTPLAAKSATLSPSVHKSPDTRMRLADAVEQADSFQWTGNLRSLFPVLDPNGEVGEWITADPEAAIATISALPPSLRAATLNTTLRSVSQTDVTAVMAMIAALPDASGTDARMIYAASTNYREWFPEQASQWLQSLQPGYLRDHAISGFVGGDLGELDPEAAASWSAAVGDPELRATLLDSAVNVWVFHQPSEARQWLQNTDRLSGSDRARLLERIDRPRP